MLTHARGREGTTKTIQRLLKRTEAHLPFGAQRLEGEVAVAALAARRREPERKSQLRRPEGFV
jgi:hypothetical protein